MPFYLATSAALGAMLSAAALWVQYSSRRAERDNPPQGRFVEVNGARLHYVEFGRGEPLVLFHGQGSMIQDFVISGLVGLAAKDYRVIVFDRPGYGYSDRPRGTIWTPAAQAALFNAALAQLGVFRTIILGHSWGASVAVAYALQYRDAARALVLVSGYYYPTLRADVAVQSGQAVPMVGDLLRYTVSPLVGRMAWPRLTRKIFEPAPVPAKFALFPVAMALRPGSLQASAAEAALMIPDAAALKPHYPELRMPVAIVAGEGDEVVPTERHSARLHREIPQSTFHALPGAGHMIHHSAPGYVLGAIHEAASASRKVEAEASVQDNIAA